MSDHKLGDAVFNDDRARAGEGQRVLQAAEAIWGRSEVPSKHEALHRPETQGNRQERLAEASHRIKELNNSLHGAGQPLHGSNLELIGFDKKGRLLLLEREKDGGIQGKVLVDSHTGKIVAKTKPGELDKWQKGQDYERDAQGGTYVYRFEVRDDGALVQHKNAKDHRIYGVDGSIVDEAAGKQKVVRAGVKR